MPVTLIPGLVSISFRKHTPEEIVKACSEAGLKYVEWGSDVHVPAGNESRARDVRDLCSSAGITPGAYGSYFRLGQGGPDSFRPFARTAEALGAGVIRIWGGTLPSGRLNAAAREALATEARAVCAVAKEHGLTVTLECHSDTITDEYHSAIEFLRAVDRPELRLYWQPSQFHTESYNRDAARAYAPYTVNVHVFTWEVDRRLPLEAGERLWNEVYLPAFSDPALGDRSCGLLLEFMHDDRLETLISAGQTLKDWIARQGAVALS